MKLTDEQRERLETLTDTEVWEDLSQVLRTLVRNHEEALCNSSIDDELMIHRAKLEGARSVAAGILNLKTRTKEKRKNGRN